MIQFYNQISESQQECPEQTAPWLSEVIKNEGFKEGEINYIFVDDDTLLEKNKEYLNHDTYTDIITFDTSDEPGEISGDIYISTDRVIENSREYGVPYPEEMHRVLVHGILHLCGYDDKTEEEKKKMREKEDYYLSQLDFSGMLQVED